VPSPVVAVTGEVERRAGSRPEILEQIDLPREVAIPLRTICPEVFPEFLSRV
jgi:hypothetical protein